MHKAESDLRIADKFTRGKPVTFKFNGTVIDAFEGESVATALLGADIVATRISPKGYPRGPVCLMGSCQECAVLIDGRKVLGCQTRVVQDLDVETEQLSA